MVIMSCEDSANSYDQVRDTASPLAVIIKSENKPCNGCGALISERYLLKVGCDGCWHEACLRCTVCQETLNCHGSCFVKEGHVYCKMDYNKNFGVKCARCGRLMQPTDWVRKARDSVYHLACFACDNCKRQLSTGEEFALQDSKVLCKTHYVELVDGGPAQDENGSASKKAKRVRTTFSEEQVQVLQANFQIDSNPDGQDLERIAQITGLSKRVTQVWFQNSRARQKKHQQLKQQQQQHHGHLRHQPYGHHMTPDCSPLSQKGLSNSSYPSPEQVYCGQGWSCGLDGFDDQVSLSG